VAVLAPIQFFWARKMSRSQINPTTQEILIRVVVLAVVAGDVGHFVDFPFAVGANLPPVVVAAWGSPKFIGADAVIDSLGCNKGAAAFAITLSQVVVVLGLFHLLSLHLRHQEAAVFVAAIRIINSP
jgi:hypothetical protein